MGQLRFVPSKAEKADLLAGKVDVSDVAESVIRTDSGKRHRINKVALGEPTVLEDGTLVWDDARFPNGTIDSDGTITVDEVGEL